MIVIGYQGIGKSTIAKNGDGFIDLESGCFWHEGKRPDDWYIYYCQIAEHLSKQGYIVFTSSHKIVVDYLKNSNVTSAIIVHPALCLKDEWIEKLRIRYNASHLEKDYKAWKNAEDRYEDNIRELMASGLPCFEIDNMNYSLFDIVTKANSIISGLEQVFAQHPDIFD